MNQSLQNASNSLGADLRALRKARGVTLAEMAESLNKSVGWFSQIERDISEPSISDLRAISAYLGVSMSMLFRHDAAPANEAGFILRQGSRRSMGSRAAGLVEELLSPDLTDDFEMVYSTFAPESRITTPVQRPTQEVGYLISGHLDLEIAGQLFHINPGDSFRIRGEPFRWHNPHQIPAVAVWVIAPPVY